MIIYETVSGDTWDIISKNVYGKEKFADQLMAANWPLLGYMIFPAGIGVRCPDLHDNVDQDLPLWRD